MESTIARSPSTLDVSTDSLRSQQPFLTDLGTLGGNLVSPTHGNYWWTVLSEHISEATTFGFAQRALLNQTNPTQPNVGTQGAPAPVNGGGFDSPLGGNEYLHNQNYGAAVDNHGNADCETGQRGYTKKLNYLDPQGPNVATDTHTPGDQGPTFRGRPSVPAGETYTRSPQTRPPQCSRRRDLHPQPSDRATNPLQPGQPIRTRGGAASRRAPRPSETQPPPEVTGSRGAGTIRMYGRGDSQPSG